MKLQYTKCLTLLCSHINTFPLPCDWSSLANHCINSLHNIINILWSCNLFHHLLYKQIITRLEHAVYLLKPTLIPTRDNYKLSKITSLASQPTWYVASNFEHRVTTLRGWNTKGGGDQGTNGSRNAPIL